MIFISHRGNIDGRIPERENEPSYIQEALNKGYDVEVDVWYENGSLILGHDKQMYPVGDAFLMNNHLWCHAKSIIALRKLLDNVCHCFSHDKDYCVLTSRNRIWVYPGNQLVEGSIAVLPELSDYSDEYLKEMCYGICSDFIRSYKETIR